MRYIILNKEEKQILNDFEKDQFVSVVDLGISKTKYIEYAKNSLNKNKNVNLRLAEKDLQKIKIKASQSGLPYQTLLSALIHQYADDAVKIKI